MSKELAAAGKGIIRAVDGVENVIKKARERRAKLAEACERGLKKAGLRLQRESMKLVPVNFGVLKASAFTRATGHGYDTVVRVGYTAAYAAYVHELVAMKLKGKPRPKGRGFYWDPQGRAQAKFLEQPARAIRKDLLKIIKEEMQKV